jgi:hypothetical protein
MAASLASATFSPHFLRRSARFGVRLFAAARPPRRPAASATAAPVLAAAQPQPAHPTAWTAEEQQFLRTLREAGL